MARSFPEKENHIVYDAGSSSITASVVSFFNSKVADPTKVLKSSLKNSTAIHVKGIGYDTVASGTELDRRLRNVLVQMFEKQTGKPVKDNSRAMARLWKEAGRVKSVLSANTDSSIAVESLAHDKDFKSSISRATFEKLASDLKPRYAQPILDALAAANMTMVSRTAHCFMFQLFTIHLNVGRYQIRNFDWWCLSHPDDPKCGQKYCGRVSSVY